MDDPKKPSNDPVSSGNKETTESKLPDAAPGEEPGTADEQDISPSGISDDSAEPEKDEAESLDNESPENNGNSTGQSAEESTYPGTDTEITDESPETIEDTDEPYNDPYDSGDIYGDYNDEHYEESDYASEPEQMPERPDDPYIEETESSEDRAGEEDVVPGIVKKSEADSSKSKKDAPSDDDEDEDPLEETERELGGRMSFLDHLDELRKRIFHAMIAIIVTFVVAWIFREHIFGFLSAPILEVVDQLVVLKPTEPFTVYLKVSFAAAIFFAIPYIMFQVWLFIAPGLYRKEKIYSLPFLFASSVLFILGGMFAYYIILPPALNFLLNDFGSKFTKVISAVEFYDFELIIIVGMGAIFQLPVVVAFLSMFGLVTPGFMWRNFKYAFLLITIIAAVVSPTTDPMNLFLWSGPMVILYTFSIGISWIFKRRRAKKKEIEEERYK
jgi:sec-independent protein translocase protein TatC